MKIFNDLLSNTDVVEVEGKEADELENDLKNYVNDLFINDRSYDLKLLLHVYHTWRSSFLVAWATLGIGNSQIRQTNEQRDTFFLIMSF